LHPRCPGITARAVYPQPDPQGIQDAAQRPQCLEQIRSLSRPARAIWAGDRNQPVPAPAAGGQRPLLFASVGQYSDQVILRHGSDGRRVELWAATSFSLS
jgi:hypothetical protein